MPRSLRHPASGEIRQRQQRERHRGDEAPETAPDVGAAHRGGIHEQAGRGLIEPLRQHDPLLVEAGAEGDAMVDDKQPEQQVRDVHVAAI